MASQNRYSGIDEYAVEQIRYKAWALVGTAGYTWDDVEDIEQDLMLDLLEGMGQFDETKSKRTTFIDRVISNKITNIIRDRRAAKRDICKEGPRLDQVVENEDGEIITVQETVSSDEYFDRMGCQTSTVQENLEKRIDLERAIQQLTPEDQKIVRLLMEMSISDVARELGMPRMTLAYRVRRIRKTLIELGLDENWRLDSSFRSYSG